MGIQALHFQHHHHAICLYNRKCAIVNNFTLLITKKRALESKPYIHYCLLSYLCSFFLALFFTFFYIHFFFALSGLQGKSRLIARLAQHACSENLPNGVQLLQRRKLWQCHTTQAITATCLHRTTQLQNYSQHFRMCVVLCLMPNLTECQSTNIWQLDVPSHHLASFISQHLICLHYQLQYVFTSTILGNSLWLCSLIMMCLHTLLPLSFQYALHQNCHFLQC